jgi:hypothetical protein
LRRGRRRGDGIVERGEKGLKGERGEGGAKVEGEDGGEKRKNIIPSLL